MGRRPQGAEGALARESGAEARPPVAIRGLNGGLRRLKEEVVGVEDVPLRAAHRMRRYVMTEVHVATGNLALTGQYVGDHDLRTLARSCLRERPEEPRRAVEHMERAMAGTIGSVADRATDDHQTTTAAREGAAADSELTTA